MTATDIATLQTALNAYDQGQLQAAEPMLRALAEKYPENFDANEALGSLYAESGAVEHALLYLEKACRISPGQAIARANLGAAYLKLNRYPQAVRELQAAAKLDPGNGATQSNLGQALMQVHRPQEAEKAFSIAAQADTQNVDLRYNWAIASLQAGDLQRTNMILKETPPAQWNDQMHSLAGEVNEQLGNYKQALEEYQAAAQLNSSDANLYALTFELLRHWTWAEAIKIANYGLQKYPESIHFAVAAGIAHYGNSDYAGAAPIFSNLLQRHPENKMLAQLLGLSCSAVGAGGNQGCDILYSFAMKHPQNASAAMYAAEGILQLPSAQQDLPRAQHLLEMAIAADPKLAEAYYQMGVLLQLQEKWQASTVVLEKAVTLRPAYAEAHYRLSRAYAHLGQRSRAMQEIALQQQYKKAQQQNLDKRLQEMITFLVKSN